MNSMHGAMGDISLRNQVPGVKISVESLPESKIQEISFDGTETYYRTLTMSENLCKMASKIDFLAEEEGRATEDDEADEFTKMPFQNQRSPWEPIQTRLQQALTEINVLTDVLSITQNKGPPKKEGVLSEGKYMTFDYAKKDVIQIKPNLLLPAKKKGLLAASEILLNGEKRMKGAGESNVSSGYHHELRKLRKFWRVRKIGTKVLGDFSYRTVGSDFFHGGNFEVIKTTDSDNVESSANVSMGRFFTKQQPKQKSPLKVMVSADLKGTATIRFTVLRQKQSNQQLSSTKSFTLHGLVKKTDPEWHKTLCHSQHVLYCRELFERLAQQAVQYKTTTTLTPFWVVGNKITATILPGAELVIELITNSDDNGDLKTSTQIEPESCSDDIFSLKIAAMQLLVEDYQKVFNIPAPHPAAAVFGLSRVQRKAATAPFNILQMQRITKEESKTLLERLVEMAKHWELKKRVCDAIEALSSAILDPYINSQWSTLGNAVETNVRICILSAGYEVCNRTLIDLSIGTDTLRALQKDGKVIQLPSDIHHIQVYFLSMLCLHELCTAQDLCAVLGWSIQYFSPNSGIGARTALGSACSLMAVSPIGNCSVSLRCWVSGCDEEPLSNAKINYEVHTQIARSDVAEGDSPSLRRQHMVTAEMNVVQNAKWSLLGKDWREVDLPKLFGRHFIEKFESLLTFLRTDF